MAHSNISICPLCWATGSGIGFFNAPGVMGSYLRCFGSIWDVQSIRRIVNYLPSCSSEPMIEYDGIMKYSERKGGP